jgi:hypothetical protein
MDIHHPLPVLILEAVAWATEHSEKIQSAGSPLNESEVALARKVGVQMPERVRIQFVPQLPLPSEAMRLRQFAEYLGLQGMAGLTLGYGIYLVKNRTNVELICHELRHVQQYESLGGIEPFMRIYLEQIDIYGYDRAPLESDAQAYESKAHM